jgi:hypothetical protein
MDGRSLVIGVPVLQHRHLSQGTVRRPSPGGTWEQFRRNGQIINVAPTAPGNCEARDARA